MLGGFRRGELLALEWSDVDYVNESITIQKSISLTTNGQAQIKAPKTEASVRYVDMPSWYMDELREFHLSWRQEKLQAGQQWIGGDHQFVFHGGLGKPYHSDRPTKAWSDFLKRNGFRHIRLHDLRHSAATLLIEAGVSLKAIQERLGHTKYQTTADLYAHVTKKVSKETAAKLEKFDPRRKA
jgi:integrase